MASKHVELQMSTAQHRKGMASYQNALVVVKKQALSHHMRSRSSDEILTAVPLTGTQDQPQALEGETRRTPCVTHIPLPGKGALSKSDTST